ncbi:MAG TPA: DUF2267 domain-containing protein [Devosiaceae bacterium]|nr:DUF2267 domain-containing protein [Devosiaceae bacterium]
MSANGLEVFDKTLQTTNIWLDEIMEDHGPDRQVAWHVLGAVLREIRDLLPTELAAHLAAELPMLVRGTYYEQYAPEKQPIDPRNFEAVSERLHQRLHGVRPVNSEDALRSVFKVLSHHLDPGQVSKVREALPADVRRFWPDPETRH